MQLDEKDIRGIHIRRKLHLLLFTDNCIPGKPNKLNYKSMANNMRTYEMDGYKISV